MTDDFISAQILQAAQLTEVEPIQCEAGPLVLVVNDTTLLGVMRQPSGRVKLNCVRDDKVEWGRSLLPEEAKWLREALEKMGY